MKHRVRKLALVLVLALLLSAMALAAGDTDRATVTASDESVTLRFNAENQTNLTLTKTGVTDGGMYLVLVLAGKETDGTPLVPTEDNILYINQATASGSTVTFDNVYPSSIQNSTVYLSGTDLSGLTKMGEITSTVTVGDVNGDGKINTIDVTRILRSLAGALDLSENEKAAGDVNGDGQVNTIDVTRLLKYLAGQISSLS